MECHGAREGSAPELQEGTRERDVILGDLGADGVRPGEGRQRRRGPSPGHSVCFLIWNPCPSVGHRDVSNRMMSRARLSAARQP